VETAVAQTAAASLSAVGIETGPPNALEAPNPTSSSKMRSTFGAFFGGRLTSMGGSFSSIFFASKTIGPVYT
jgi:hypothetical protein